MSELPNSITISLTCPRVPWSQMSCRALFPHWTAKPSHFPKTNFPSSTVLSVLWYGTQGDVVARGVLQAREEKWGILRARVSALQCELVTVTTTQMCDVVQECTPKWLTAGCCCCSVKVGWQWVGVCSYWRFNEKDHLYIGLNQKDHVVVFLGTGPLGVRLGSGKNHG